MCFPGVPRNLRNDLLVAADSITNTMSSLVKELHSGTEVFCDADPFVVQCGDSDVTVSCI